MRDRLTLIIAITALVVAVLGTTPIGEAAYNAVVPKNSVGAQQLRKGAVTSVKIRGDAVTSGKVKNRSLKAIDFKLGQLPAGAAGAKGDKGDKGDKGEAGITAVVVRRSPELTTAGPGTLSRLATCQSGEVALGGGVGRADGITSSALTVRSSLPSSNVAGATPTAWKAVMTYQNAGETLVVYVVCAKIAP